MELTRSEHQIPWWREPTRHQWLAWTAGWLGWTLDAFDFTIFLLLLVPIAQEFHVPLTAAAVIVTLTLLAGYHDTGLATAMLIGTGLGAVSFCLARLSGPETRGTEFVPEPVVA